MKPGAGKGKGSQFERDVAKALSLWLTNGERPDTIWRSEISGGRFTCSKGTSGTAGDLVATHPAAFTFCSEYVLECKSWKRLEIHKFLQGEGDLFKALEKVKRESVQKGNSWMLIAKQNFQPIFVFMSVSCSVAQLVPWSTENHMLFGSSILMTPFEKLLKVPVEQTFNDRLTPSRFGTGVVSVADIPSTEGKSPQA